MGVEQKRQGQAKSRQTKSRQAKSRQTRSRKERRKRARRRQIVRIALALALIGLIIISVVMIIKGLSRDELKGIWAYDQTTIYEFDGRGNGMLHLPLDNYNFSYTRKDGCLMIDFTDENATDVVYSYTIEGNVLTLDNNTGSVFCFEKQK